MLFSNGGREVERENSFYLYKKTSTGEISFNTDLSNTLPSRGEVVGASTLAPISRIETPSNMHSMSCRA